MELNMSWGELAQAAGGTLVLGRASDPVHSLSTDTRRIAPGQAFWALRGKSHDAHRFLEEPAARGADGWVLQQGASLPARLPRHVVEVRDTLQALADLAALHRKRFSIPVVGITGSNGKTTTKELLKAALSVRGPVCANPGSLNNEVGLPLTVLELGREHAFAVLEMGASKAGDIAYLGRIARPSLAVLTNIGSAHAQFFGGLEGTFKAKSELVDCLPEDAPVVLNLDDPWLRRLLPRLGKRAVGFGRGEEARVRMLDCGPGELRLRLQDGEVLLQREWIGEIHRLNAAAAAAAAQALGLGPGEIEEGLKGYQPGAMRFEPRRHKSGALLLVDAYNANPESMRAGLKAFLETAPSLAGRPDPELLAVLGDMRELGESSAAMHRELGRWLATLPLAGAFLAGAEMAEAARGLSERGAPFPVAHREDPAALLPELRERMKAGTALYFKASRGMRLEALAETL